MKHLRHLLALALAAALTLMLLLPTYAAVIDGVYTDYMTGLKFTIPADWEEYAAPSTMPSYIKETFAYQKDGAFSMMGYGSVDLWMAALSNGQISGTREELDNSAFTAEDIASLFGASSDIISTAAYGGVEYYTARITSSTNVSGTDFEATFLYALRIENGYLYLFYISEDADGPHYRDFESLLSSVRYPSADTDTSEPPVPSSSTDTTTNRTTSRTASGEVIGHRLLVMLITILFFAPFAVLAGHLAKKKGRSFWGFFALGYILSPLLSLLIVLCLKPRQPDTAPDAEPSPDAPADEPAQAPISMDNTPSGDAPMTPSASESADQSAAAETTILHVPDVPPAPVSVPPVPPAVRFCSRCGAQLTPGSRFCDSCGHNLDDDLTSPS